jgi:hypothetical protein
MSNHRHLKSDFLALAILVGISVLIGIYLIATTVLIAKDGVFYIDQARRLSHDPLSVARRYPPGYPFLLWTAHQAARLFAKDDSVMLWVYSAQGMTLLCRVLALIPLYLLGRLLVGPRDSFWALLILIILPYPAQYGSDVLREWPYVLFLSLSFWLLYRGLREGRWWAMGLAGLAAGLGYLIRQESGQLVIYGLLGLIPLRMADGGLRIKNEGRATSGGQRLGAGLLLIAGFAVPAVPYACAIGAVMPHQLRQPAFNTPPVIVSVGGKAADDGPLEFEVRAGELLELPVETFDAEKQKLTFSLASVPLGSRPVYRFRSMTMGTHFWTISEEEKNLLLASYPREVWDYDAVAYYAYADPGVTPGLQPVHRFWSPTRQKHFYTMDEAEKDAIVKESLADPWMYEGIVHYAFPAPARSAVTSAQGGRPVDAAPVYRFWNQESGYFWAVKDPKEAVSAAEGESSVDTVAWYAHVAGAPPAGAALENGTLRWRPGRDQQGEYQVNIIVSDARAETCRLVRIRVREPAEGGRKTEDKEQRTEGATPRGTPAPILEQYAGLSKLPEAVDKLFDAIAENLVVVFLVPWFLGLYHRLRHEAQQPERVMMAALLVVNVGLMLARYAWIAPGSNRRYSLGLIALTIFYIPTGLDIMARWLTGIFAFGRGSGASHDARRSGWFYVLVAVGAAVCVPKYAGALRPDKESYRAAARWLQQNTQANDVIAVPDSRISFYAGRPGFMYHRYPDPRQADYMVEMIDGQAKAPVVPGWSREYALDADQPGDKTLIIYKTLERRK